MKFIASLIILILGFIYYPLNLLFIRVQKWYLPMWKKDKIIYFAFAPFYWILTGLVVVISYPMDLLSKVIH